MSIIPEDTGNNCDANPQLLIDEKIAHFEECIRQLKAQRNDLAPISKLPPEILARIFSFALSGRTRTSPVLTCYYFSHVSALWRSVALNTPTLWQVLPRNIQWATAMLERSKGADLVVESRVDSPNQSVFLTEVLTTNTSRIRELDLTGFKISTLFKNVQLSSLRLHSLKLECTSTSGLAPFPTGVLETTDLRTLSLTGCSGAWCSLPYPALTNLRLHDIINRPPLNEFLQMLRGAAALEVLDMDNSLPSAFDHVDLTRPIELPLSYLCLLSTNDYREVTNILSVIIVPRTATLKLGVVHPQPVTNQVMGTVSDGLASSLKSFFCRYTDLAYRKLHVSIGSHLCLEAWKDDRAVSPIPDLELALTPSFQYMLRPIISSIPMFDITTLTLDVVLAHTLLKDIFGQLSRLQNVKVLGDCTPGFIQILTSKPKKYNTKLSAYYSVSFPVLESLWIEDCSFKEGGACTVEDLQDCLMERYERKAEILKLKLTECRELWYDDVQSLRHIVNDVEWDEWEEIDESDESEDSEDDYSDDYYSDDYYYSW